jgi:integrase
MLRVSSKGKRIDLYTGISVQEKQWSTKTKRVKHGCSISGTPYNVMNDTIDAQILFINDYFTKKAMLDLIPSLDDLKATFNTAFKGSEAKVITNDFYLLFETFINKRKETRNWDKSMVDTFTRLKDILQEYDPDLSFSGLSEEKMNGIVNKLSETMYNDSIIKRLFYLKQFVHWAQGEGYPVHKDFFNYDIKLPKVKKDVRFIYPDELDRIMKLDLEEGSTIEQVRDSFVFACHTALRHSDLMQLTQENIRPRKEGDGYEIRKLTEKDDDVVFYKLSKVATDIYLKYKDKKYKGGKLLPVIQSQHFNDYLKEIGKMVKLEGNWVDYEYKIKEKITVITARTELSSHVARRTFIVTAYNQGIPLDLIALVTSHNDVKAMKPYLKATSTGADKVIAAIDKATMGIKQEETDNSKDENPGENED